ncbi:hypothetical protein ACN42_g10899 [Penicillium freii]|uniref:F-box domain-containing protein n=1 Tax=Penicillium freii TaxID=48697 RepID=A0A101M9C8_PENFR|nr:hypothetical protein ACN42_g10899 [Penicillium freii]
MLERILTDLPLEIFWLIVKNLECEKDINTVTQVNRGLYNLLNPYLYRINVDNRYNHAIAWGAYHGQEATVRKALEQGVQTWFIFISPKLITLTALRGHANIAKLLLDYGANSTSSHSHEGSLLSRGCKRCKNIFVPRAWDLSNASGKGCFETLKVLAARRAIKKAKASAAGKAPVVGAAKAGAPVPAAACGFEKLVRACLDAMQMTGCMENIVLSAWMLPTEHLTAGII